MICNLHIKFTFDNTNFNYSTTITTQNIKIKPVILEFFRNVLIPQPSGHVVPLSPKNKIVPENSSRLVRTCATESAHSPRHSHPMKKKKK